MRVRYAVNDRGQLEDRAGNVLGRLTSLTIDLGQGGTTGGVGGPHLEHRQLTRKAAERTEGGAGETAFDPDVEDVWAYWCVQRRPRFTTLEPSQARLIRKGIEQVGVDGLKRAIGGLLASEFHRERKLLQLSSILKTRPGGATLRDQLEAFIERSPSPSPTAVEPAAPAARIARLRSEITKLSVEDLRPGDYAFRDELVQQLHEEFGVKTIFEGSTARFEEPS